MQLALRKLQTINNTQWERIIIIASTLFAMIATYISFTHGWILAYADAESHINLSKKVVSSLTPGFAQLGGIWLPLTHILMIPFVIYDPFWRTGIAGSIVAGFFYVISGLYIFKITNLLTNNKFASIMAFLAFALNSNVLYMQSTPMTEIPLIAFFILSSYYFILYLLHKNTLVSLMLAALFAFGASLVRYDGWFLVIIEALTIFIIESKWWKPRLKTGGLILFSTLAFFGIGLWFLWNGLILGDPLYFEHSQYSAKVQQLAWMQKGELPAYHNLLMSLQSYSYIVMLNAGVIITGLSLLGAIYFLFNNRLKRKKWIILTLLIPFIFNIISQYMGEDVIFAPGLVPNGFEWKLFNVRYGLLMIPFISVFFGYVFSEIQNTAKVILVGLFAFQLAILMQPSQTITLVDGLSGLSTAKTPWDMQSFLNNHYNGGYVLFDDYARQFSLTRSTIPMQKMIYVGVRPYWTESLNNPSKFASWIIIQQGDAVYTAIMERPPVEAELNRNFKLVYNKNQIQIYQRTTSLALK